jgi:hypothetical protein
MEPAQACHGSEAIIGDLEGVVGQQERVFFFFL